MFLKILIAGIIYLSTSVCFAKPEYWNCENYVEPHEGVPGKLYNLILKQEQGNVLFGNIEICHHPHIKNKVLVTWKTYSSLNIEEVINIEWAVKLKGKWVLISGCFNIYEYDKHQDFCRDYGITKEWHLTQDAQEYKNTYKPSYVTKTVEVEEWVWNAYAITLIGGQQFNRELSDMNSNLPKDAKNVFCVENGYIANIYYQTKKKIKKQIVVEE